jgi:AraC-like DNA-binding protein
MSQAFPLVRAGVLVPFLQWMRANGLPVDGPLRAVDLPELLGEDADRPVALASVLAFAHALARRTGADIGCRVVSETSIAHLGSLGHVMLGARTPREALTRLTAVMNRHCTHEWFALVPTRDGVFFRERITLGMDAEIRHVQHQYVASLVRTLCAATGYKGEPFGRVELAPHPAAGVDHLRRWLGPDLAPARGQTLSIFVPSAVIDRPFPRRTREHAPAPDIWTAIRGDGSYAGTAQVVVDAMLDDGEPAVQRLAAASGASLRTVQRRLEAEGTSFTRLLDDARRARALRELVSGLTPIGEIGVQLGYAGRPAFTRAVRRWTSTSPKSLRTEGPIGQPAEDDSR